MALSAAPLVAAQPAPLNSSAGNNCHAAWAFAQTTAPAEASSAPDKVTLATPKRR